MTVKELINASGRLIGELRSGRSFADDELTDLLVSLNNMLGEWSAEQFGIYRTVIETIDLNGSPGYIWPDPPARRPVRIIAAETATMAGIRRPARIVNAAEWNAVIRDRNETGLFIEIIFPDYGWPRTSIEVWPVPAAGGLFLAVLAPLTAFLNLADTVDLPVGYEEGLVYNFAVKIAPEFNKEPTQTIAIIAERARKAIAASNAQLLPSVPVPPVAVPA